MKPKTKILIISLLCAMEPSMHGSESFVEALEELWEHYGGETNTKLLQKIEELTLYM